MEDTEQGAGPNLDRRRDGQIEGSAVIFAI
jgi:hypothetical protein